MTDLTRSQFLELVRSAVLAPSADNHHRVRFEPIAGGLRLWGDEYFRACQEQHRRQFMVFACGAMVENISIKASEFGLACDSTAFPDPARKDLISTMTWRESPAAAPDALLSAIEKRHTNRKFFRGPLLSEAERDALSAATRADSSIRVRWFTAPSERDDLLSLVRIGETERFARRALHEELFSAVDWRVGWSTSCDEGLPPGTLEVEMPLRPGFRAMAWWPLMRALSALQAHRLLGLRAAYFPCRINATMGVLSASRGTPPAVLDAGRVFQRLWLCATHLGLALQPLAASVALTLTPNAPGWTRPKIQARLSDGWHRLLDAETPMMVFRVGHASEPNVRTGRRAPELYMLQGKNS